MSFPSFDTKKSFFEVQQEMLEFWKKEHIFEESIQSRKESPAYRFYDGPPFITGIPHYGHIL
jgi:isoleucyl-tRNA synthetase